MAVDMNKLTDGNALLYALKGLLTGKVATLLAGKVDKVDGKGLSTNDYTTAEKEKLGGIAAGANNYTLPTAGSALGGVKTTSQVTDASGYTPTPIIGGVPYYKDTNTTYSDVSQTAHGLMTAADKKKLDGVAENANNYTHPAHTAAAAGLYKVTVDALGHVTAVTKVAKADITGLGIPAQDTTYSDASQSAHGLMSVADKKKLDAFSAASSYATTTYVGQQIAAAGHISKTIVTALPAASAAKENVIYLVKKSDGSGSNLYDEYMLINGALELVGDSATKIDTLSNADIEEILAQV